MPVRVPPALGPPDSEDGWVICCTFHILIFLFLPLAVSLSVDPSKTDIDSLLVRRWFIPFSEASKLSGQVCFPDVAPRALLAASLWAHHEPLASAEGTPDPVPSICRPESTYLFPWCPLCVTFSESPLLPS